MRGGGGGGDVIRGCGMRLILQLEHKRNDEKVERDRLNGIYLELVEQQRAYYKSVRDFQEV